MERPRPVPPKRRDMEGSAWEKGWKSRSMPEGGMPMPVSSDGKLQAGVAVPRQGAKTDLHVAALGKLNGVAG